MAANPHPKPLQAVTTPIADGYELFSFTDQGNTELFVTEYKDQLRYDHGRKRWLVWRGQWWESAKGGEVQRLNMKLVRKRERWARKLLDAKDVGRHLKWL